MRRPAAAGNSGIRTGIRWKLSAAIAMVGALVAVALSLVVHNAARVSMLDNSRDLADERITVAERMYESGRTQAFGVKVDDPGHSRTALLGGHAGPAGHLVADRPNGVPDIWAAVPLKDGRVLSLHTGFTDRNTDVMKDLDQALIIGSIAVVFGGSALGVLIGGQVSRRLRKAAAAANQVAKGETDVRVREAIGGVVRDETDDLARAVDAMADALQQHRGRAPGDRRHRPRTAHAGDRPADGGGAPSRPPHGTRPRPGPGDADPRRGRPRGGAAGRRLRAGRTPGTSCSASSCRGGWPPRTPTSTYA